MSRERGAVRVVNTTRGTVVGSTVFFAGTWWGRAKGWLGRPAPIEGEGLLLQPCKGIHMIGMNYAIDVAFLDEDGNVVATYGELEPWQRTRMHSKAQSALELPAGTLARTGTVVGDHLSWEETQ